MLLTDVQLNNRTVRCFYPNKQTRNRRGLSQGELVGADYEELPVNNG